MEGKRLWVLTLRLFLALKLLYCLLSGDGSLMSDCWWLMKASTEESKPPQCLSLCSHMLYTELFVSVSPTMI